jgi:heterodisulfide reductase subunit B
MTVVTMSAAEPLAEVVRRAAGQNVYRCYQCVKCASGCPLADAFDLTPNRVVRSVQFDDAQVLESKTIWLCASCQTCTTRCPQEIDVAAVMDALRMEAKRRGVAPAVPEIDVFNRLFLRLVKSFGRLYELGLSLAFNLARKRPLDDLGLGLALFRRGRLKLRPAVAWPPRKVTPVARRSDRTVGFFPGCSLDSTAAEYGRTVRSVADALDLELVEPPGWVCCGSSPAQMADATLAKALPMETIGTVEQMGLDTVSTPCSKCFARLKSAEHTVTRDAEAAKAVQERTGYAYEGTVTVQHLLDTLVERAGLEAVQARVERPLAGLKVACYYGCLITRPAKLTGAEHPEYPTKMDALMRALGAEPVDWSYKTECCGGALSVTQTPLALAMSRKVLENARACGAEAVVTMCPMCHMNLDARQPQMALDGATPIFHATQLMVLAFGLGAEATALKGNVVDPRPVLKERNLLS